MYRYAWDFNMAKDMDPNLVYKSIVNNRLITLPAGMSLLSIFKDVKRTTFECFGRKFILFRNLWIY